MLSGLSHPMIFVQDIPRAVKWYVDVLSFRTLFVAGPHYASLFHDKMKLRLDLHPKRDDKDVGHGAVIYFNADDFDAEIASLRQRGIRVEDPRSESGSPRFTAFYDSEGNELGLCEKGGN